MFANNRFFYQVVRNIGDHRCDRLAWRERFNLGGGSDITGHPETTVHRTDIDDIIIGRMEINGLDGSGYRVALGIHAQDLAAAALAGSLFDPVKLP